jgi:microcystin-dependent protein
MEDYIATIMLWPCSWVPRGWLFCNGQLLSIQSNQVLFSLIGTTYGGDGVTNFMLPDMQSVKTVSGAEVKYIICFEGIYPSRD